MFTSHPFSKFLSCFYVVIGIQIETCTGYTFRNCGNFPNVKSSILEALNFAEYGAWRMAGNDPIVNINVVTALLGSDGKKQFVGR
jgi:hypothetical protein